MPPALLHTYTFVQFTWTQRPEASCCVQQAPLHLRPVQPHPDHVWSLNDVDSSMISGPTMKTCAFLFHNVSPYSEVQVMLIDNYCTSIWGFNLTSDIGTHTTTGWYSLYTTVSVLIHHPACCLLDRFTTTHRFSIFMRTLSLFDNYVSNQLPQCATHALECHACLPHPIHCIC